MKFKRLMFDFPTSLCLGKSEKFARTIFDLFGYKEFHIVKNVGYISDTYLRANHITFIINEQGNVSDIYYLDSNVWPWETISYHTLL